jgi:hypothetical protein
VVSVISRTELLAWMAPLDYFRPGLSPIAGVVLNSFRGAFPYFTSLNERGFVLVRFFRSVASGPGRFTQLPGHAPIRGKRGG